MVKSSTRSTLTLVALFAASLFLHCAAFQFSGVYQGSISQAGVCDDGNRLPAASEPVSYVLSERDATIRWTTECGAVATARIAGNVATVEPYTCPTYVRGNNNVVQSVSQGTLTLSGSRLVVEQQTQYVFTGGYTGRCSASLSGVLTRSGN